MINTFHKRLAIIVAISATSILIIIVLSDYSKSDQYVIQLQRKVQDSLVVIQSSVDIKYNSYYIAGITDYNIYLGNYSNPSHLLQINFETRTIEPLTISFPEFIAAEPSHITIDSPYVWVVSSKFLLKGSVNDQRPKIIDTVKAQLYDLRPIGQSSYVAKSLNPETVENSIVRSNTIGSDFEYRDLLEKQIDGVFCTDGMLCYDKLTHTLVYTYYYRNQFLCIDTTLNIIKRGNTIDSISKAKISIEKIHSENSITMAAPPLLVNRKMCVSGGFLYIDSNLKSLSEMSMRLESISIIDIYDLHDNTYQSSFYFPARFSDFMVHKGHVFFVIDKQLAIYKIMMDELPRTKGFVNLIYQ